MASIRPCDAVSKSYPRYQSGVWLLRRRTWRLRHHDSNAMASLANTIFTNITLTPEGEGDPKEMTAHTSSSISRLGGEKVDARGPLEMRGKAHPNAQVHFSRIAMPDHRSGSGGS